VGKSLNTFTWRKDIASRANVAWEGETTAGGLTTVTAFARKNDHGQLPNYTITGCAGTTCRGTLNNNHVESLGVDVKHEQSLVWNKAKLVSGITIDRSQNDYVSDNLAITRDTATGRYVSYVLNSVKNPSGVRNYSAEIANNAAFAQFEFVPLEKLRIVAGARYDSISYDFQNNLTPGANYGATNEVRSFSRVTPKLGGTYALNSRNSFYGNLSQGFTPPEVSQLYGKTAVPDLKPAIYDNTELGWRAALLDGSVKLDSAIYRLDGKDTIVSYTPAVGDSGNKNAGQTRSEGLEIALSQEGKWMDWRFGATWAQHTYLNYKVSDKVGAIEDYSGKTMKQAPAQAINASVAYKFAPGARIALTVIKQGSSWMNDANTVKYEGHTLLNVHASQMLQGGWEVWGQVRNLTNQRYSDSASSSYKGTGTYSPNTQNTYQLGAPRGVMLGLNKSFGA
jgi:outer membrane receptor protein involved in Fe transport